jgi:serine/threonine-protein kinase
MTAPSQLGKYQITGVLGTGAMGVVYKGFDPGIRRVVAIKTIRRELIAADRTGAMMLKRFRNEAQAAGRLAHPGIVAVYDYGEDAAVAYIAMEYVEGNSLREYFARGTRFSERDAVSIMTQLLEALAHAHERRVWHRDIKPGNLIVMMTGRVKIADFGIARVETSDLTQTGAVLGSPGYMAPEQYAAATIDHRADLFAAGVVFYQLLTGSRPFVGTAEQVAYAICHAEPARPSLADPGKGWERYDALLMKALAKRPEDRFQTADTFRAALLEAHARPAAASIAEETIITEILRPAAALEPTVPSQPRAAAPAAPAAPPRRRGWLAGAAIAAAVIAAGVVWMVASRKDAAPPAAPAPAPAPVAVAPAAPTPAPAPAPRTQSAEEVVFWESVRGSTSRAELEAYLAKYPEGTFAPLARARIEALAAAAAAKTAPPPERKAEPRPPAPPPPVSAAPAKAEPSQEALFWESVRSSNNPAELRAYLDRYPQGTFAPLARARLDAIAAAQAKAAAEPKLNIPPRTGASQETLRVPAGADAAAKPAAAAAAPGGKYAGTWTGRIACGEFEGQAAFVLPTRVSVHNDAFLVERGTRDQPGYWTIHGVPEATGRLQLRGSGISAHPNHHGKPYVATVDGRLEGDRYEGSGKFGTRLCSISLARSGS